MKKQHVVKIKNMIIWWYEVLSYRVVETTILMANVMWQQYNNLYVDVDYELGFSQ